MTHQSRILDRRNPVSDPFRSQFEGGPNRLRPGALARMGYQVQALAFGEREDVRKPFCRTASLAAADAKRDHTPILPRGGPFRDSPRLLHSELPDRIEDPPHLHCRAFRRCADSIKDWVELLSFPQHYPGRDDDLGVMHVLRREPLQQPVRDQAIVVRTAQPLADLAERLQERIEIAVTVQGTVLGQRYGWIQFI